MRYEDVVLADGPIAYWPLTETSGTTANDISGNARHMTWSSAPTVGGRLIGGSRTAVLSGSQSASIASAAWMDLFTLTIEAWYTTLNLTSALQSILVRREVASWWALYVSVNSQSGVPGFVGGNTVFTGSSVTAYGRLHHVVVSMANGNSGGGATACWVDGRREFAGTSTAGIPSGATNLYIGQEGGGARYHNGQIGHVALYNKVLPANRIAAHYRAGIAGPRRRAFRTVAR